MARTRDEAAVVIDAERPSSLARQLVQALNTWDGRRPRRGDEEAAATSVRLLDLAGAIDRRVTHLIAIEANTDHEALFETSDAVVNYANELDRRHRLASGRDAWQDFLRRPADYYAMLEELGFVAQRDEDIQGELPESVVRSVRDFPLDTSLLKKAPRRYQEFAAQFALVQRKVLIGDEMGLGKTFEAIMAMAHLHAKGATHSLVICPAALVPNWLREVEHMSMLPAHRLHGNERDAGLHLWRSNGGVAVTTFETLNGLRIDPGPGKLAMTVIDEAHYIKNPDAQRSRNSAQMMRSSQQTMLMTGTPLENRVAEFRALIDYIRPDLTVDASDLRPRLFRKQVAPVYLRRTQEQVLSELPEKVEVDEWLPMSRADERAYRDAVELGSFHDMRQAGMLQGSHSVKVAKLMELVDEAQANGRKVLVFSYYLRVLEAVSSALSGRRVFGPLTGRVVPANRQRLIDDFTAERNGAVLLAQIGAGGVGLNIQAASVVVICEPQLKPTTEWQAIARAHRQGQARTVQVHRLLSEDSVDVRITERLRAKAALFDEFADISEAAMSDVRAVDVSETKLIADIVAEEQARLGSPMHPAGLSRA